ncbi:UNVERIFIED_CONTAM: putative inactive receptor kinase [Sesamum radiatum]|uniref:Inactive receptor kinase n=1 Tax=Sesamum radiatum TaxID=300843 RepID=A0AAW2KD77_SESRA
MGNKIIFSAILVYGTLFLLATAEPGDDKKALLDFIGNISHSRNLNWDERTSACNSWIGVTCNHDRSRIIAILSLRSNGISGPFPSDLLKLGNLTGLYLQFNNFQGPLPLDFSVWKNLSVLNLSNNDFNGSIPSSISNLTHLTALDLANNSLSGDVPDLDIPTLQLLDLSNNNLTGVVPQTLVRFPSSAFSGNNVTLQSLPPPVLSPTAVPKKHSSKFSEPAILGIVIGSCAAAFVLIALLLIVTYRKKKDDESITGVSHKKEKSTKRTASEHQDENGRVIFFEGCNLVFDLEDLLRASAEVLGKGTFGTTYKAALEDSTTVAVKRLKEVIVGKRDFEQQMEVVGNIRHENVAPLRAYFYSKDEKLMVYDYYNQGSVSALLHAKRGEDRIPLDWGTRVKIAIGAAKGIAHILTKWWQACAWKHQGFKYFPQLRTIRLHL